MPPAVKVTVWAVVNAGMVAGLVRVPRAVSLGRFDDTVRMVAVNLAQRALMQKVLEKQNGSKSGSYTRTRGITGVSGEPKSTKIKIQHQLQQSRMVGARLLFALGVI